MKYHHLVVTSLFLFLAGCATFNEQGTISELNSVEIDLKDTKIEDGLDKAMASYQHFLEKTPETAMTPEAIRRLADLKVEKGYGALGEPPKSTPAKSGTSAAAALTDKDDEEANKEITKKDTIADVSESYKSFEKRATSQEKVKKGSKYAAAAPGAKSNADPETVGARDAIRLYNMLLKKYPLYERNDQVLYQLSRAHEEVGEVEKAMTVMSQLIKKYPNSRYLDEIYFRRAEFYFTR
ncbi:MAG: tetratricopeptide repeat protein, partial [Gammaproteobacteria bacterium]